MHKTPGFLIPSSFPNDAALKTALRNQSKKFKFEAFNENDFLTQADEVQHFGIKGMHWGVRKEQLKSDVVGNAKAKVSTTAHRVGKEYETGLVVAGAAALGLAYIHSPTAQKVMTVPVKATYHYLSVPNNRRKVGRVLKKSYVVYSKLH